jgi:hypothetical protein
MPFFSQDDLNLIRSDPSAIAGLYGTHGGQFAARLPYTDQPEAHLRLAFCGLLAYELAPYGSSTAVTLEALLAETVLDCDNYCLLAWQLFDLLDPGADVGIAMLGWNALGGNHAQLLVSTEGRPSLIIDPTYALFAETPGFDAWFSGNAVDPERVVSFDFRDATPIEEARTIRMLTDGLFTPWNLLYWTTDIASFGKDALDSATPQAPGRGLMIFPPAPEVSPSLDARPGGPIRSLEVPYINDDILNELRNEPSRIAEIYSDFRNTFLGDLGPSFASQPESHVQLAFCGLISSLMAPTVRATRSNSVTC